MIYIVITFIGTHHTHAHLFIYGKKKRSVIASQGGKAEMSGQEEEVKLVGAWYSPYVHRVAWALKLKGIKYEWVEESLNTKSSLLLHCNPVFKKVPVLLHRGKPIIESLFIIEYIDETWKHNPILPTHPYDRAMARFWALLIDDMLLESSKRVLYVEGEELRKEMEKATATMEKLEELLKANGNEFFGGETIGFLDIAFGWTAIWLEAIEEVASVQFFNPIQYPLLHNWKNKFRGIHFVIDSSFPMEKLVRFFTKYSQKSKLKLASITS